MYHLPVGISENGYPFLDNRTLNCQGVTPSHIKGGETVMIVPLQTYTMSTSHRNPQLLNALLKASFFQQDFHYACLLLA